jgi:hypothetical protein
MESTVSGSATYEEIRWINISITNRKDWDGLNIPAGSKYRGAAAAAEYPIASGRHKRQLNLFI